MSCILMNFSIQVLTFVYKIMKTSSVVYELQYYFYSQLRPYLAEKISSSYLLSIFGITIKLKALAHYLKKGNKIA